MKELLPLLVPATAVATESIWLKENNSVEPAPIIEPIMTGILVVTLYLAQEEGFNMIRFKF